MSSKKIIDKLLGELLIDRNIITSNQLEKAVKSQKVKRDYLLGEELVKLGYAKEEDIAQVLTAQYGFPYLPLDCYEIDPEIIALIPSDFALLHVFIPVDKLGNSLSIAMSNPLDKKAIEEIEKIVNFLIN